MEIAISILGYVLLWVATDIGRKEESKIKFMTGKWWIIFTLITAGTYIINNVDNWFNTL